MPRCRPTPMPKTARNAGRRRRAGDPADTPDNPTAQELRDALDGLNIDEREELLALLWLGRGDHDAQSWGEALRQARDTRTTTETDYLLGTPLLGDYLEEGVEALGLSLEGFERG